MKIAGFASGKELVRTHKPILIKKLKLYLIYIIDHFSKGMYAISVAGRLPSGIMRDMKRRGIPYRNRDTRQLYNSS